MATTIIGVSLPSSIGHRRVAGRPTKIYHGAMSDWRERLRQALKEKGLDMKAASLGANLNPSAVQQIISQGKDPRAGTLQQLADAHGLSLDAILLNREPSSTLNPQDREVRLAPVVGTVAAGLWFSLDAPPQIESEPVPYVPCRYPDLEQRAYKVQGSSMDKRRIEDGDFVIAVPYWEARMSPVAGDIAVIQRQRDGGLVEWTVKEVDITKDSVRLIPRSTDPSFQDVVTIPRTRSTDDYGEVAIVGLVVGKFSGF